MPTPSPTLPRMLSLAQIARIAGVDIRTARSRFARMDIQPDANGSYALFTEEKARRIVQSIRAGGGGAMVSLDSFQ